MKTFIRQLKEEHRLIERAAVILDRIAATVVAGGDFDAVAASDVLDFLEHFANEAHQRKEERVLFPAMLKQGLLSPRVGELLLEHVAERQALDALHADLEGAAYGHPLCRDRFTLLAREYARQQAAHAAEENSVLLPIAEEQLDPACEAEMLASLHAIEAELDMRGFAHYERALERTACRVGAVPVAVRANEPRPLLDERCELGRDGRDEAIVTLLSGHVLRERPEELALEPDPAPAGIEREALVRSR